MRGVCFHRLASRYGAHQPPFQEKVTIICVCVCGGVCVLCVSSRYASAVGLQVSVILTQQPRSHRKEVNSQACFYVEHKLRQKHFQRNVTVVHSRDVRDLVYTSKVAVDASNVRFAVLLHVMSLAPGRFPPVLFVACEIAVKAGSCDIIFNTEY